LERGRRVGEASEERDQGEETECEEVSEDLVLGAKV
jgi:hypothetical protein